MMHPRWLALPLAVLTASATVPGCATAPAPRLLSADLHIGSLDDRTGFELEERRSARADEGEELDDVAEGTDTPKHQRTRKVLYALGLGAIGFGIVGTVGFGVGGRIVQAQLKNGYEDGDLTREREDQLSTTGQVMNALAITSAVIGLAGVITAATVYGIDHARCGELRPRRKQCAGGKDDSGAVTSGSAGAGGGPAGAGGEAPAGESGTGGAGGAGGAAGSAGASTGPAASSEGDAREPEASTTEPATGPAPAAPGPSPTGGKPSPSAKPNPGTKSGTSPGPAPGPTFG